MADPNTYTVGWICALGIELVAAASFLDKKHVRPDNLPVHDNNSYILGQIDKHNIVIAALPNGQYGLVSAATVARDMVRSFPNVRIGLMVGIGGGAPSSKHDIRLGDVVVSSPSSGSDSGGVFQYDYGKAIQDSSFVVTGHLNQPPTFMLTAVNTLEARYTLDSHDIEKSIEDKLASNNRLRAGFRKPESTTDVLYNSAYKHSGSKDEDCKLLCDASQLARSSEQLESRDCPTIHYGIIASANQLMKDAILRDKLSAENDILCFEMEAAGLMNHFACIIIRGICDYSDTHKNKVWQGYAAMAAAAYAKDLIREIAPSKVEAKRKLGEFLSDFKDKLDAMSTAVEDTKSDLRDDIEGKHRANVTKWLAAPNVSSNLNRATEAHHPGSGQRLINNEAYQEWTTRSNSFLWLHGIPGCGKTVLTSTVINDLRASPNCTQALYYFYFDFTDTRKQAFENCVRSLLSQMYHTCERGREEVDALYESCSDGEDQPSNGSLQETLANIIRSGEMWIVIDALDECKYRDSLLQWLRSLRNDETNIHVVATSRPEHDIGEVMKQVCRGDKEKLAIDSNLLGADIENYVHAIIREHKDFQIWRLRPKVQAEMEACLVGKSHGMFRWVSCQLGALRKCRDPIALRKTLASLPKDLDETYSRILSDIPSEYIDHTLRILQFLTYSERPLTISEAVDAIAVKIVPDEAQGSRFNIEDRMPNPTDIVGYCSSLVVQVHGKDMDPAHQRIQLAHFSVKDYLTSDRLEGKVSPYFQATSAQSTIAEVCLAYLLELQQNMATGKILETYHLAYYSARYWASHAALVENRNQMASDYVKDLFLDHSRMQMWYLLCHPWPEEHNNYVAEGPAPSIYYASLLGLPHSCRMLLNKGADVNAPGGYYGSAIQAASYKGYEEIVSILLDYNADTNGVNLGGWQRIPLLLAVKEGHKEVVAILIDKGVDVNAKHGSALQHASSLGYTEIVSILLDGGADINRPEGGETPLLLAIDKGHKDVVRLLLDRGAQVDSSKGLSQPAPLLRAAYCGYDAIARMLLEHGAQVDSVNDEGYTPLAIAAEYGRTGVMTVLLSHNANVNGFVDMGKIPLSLACWRGRSSAAKQLIKHGAVLNDILESELLFNEAKEGHSEILELLLGAGIDHRVTDAFGRTALMYATIRNQSRAVDVLLAEPGLDVNVRDHWGATAISVAARFGRLRIFHKIAASSKVDLYAEDKFGRTCLWWAREQGHDPIADYIIEHCQGPINNELTQAQTGAVPARPRTFVDEFVLDHSCAVCLVFLDIDEQRYRCSECERGKLVICQDCFGLGARCIVETHFLSLLDIDFSYEMDELPDENPYAIWAPRN